jgi:hypothetical protein
MVGFIELIGLSGGFKGGTISTKQIPTPSVVSNG